MANARRLPWLLLVLFAAQLVLVGSSWLVDEPPGLTGGPHPRWDGLQIGEPASLAALPDDPAAPEQGSNAQPAGASASVRDVRWLGAAFGVLLFAALTVLFVSALDGPRRIRVGWAVFIAFELVLAGLLQAAFELPPGAAAPPVEGIPSATAWMLYGLWPVQLVATFFFLRGASRSELSAE